MDKDKNKDMAVIILHGMGEQKKEYADSFLKKIEIMIGKENYNKIHFHPIFYQDIMQKNQKKLYQKYEKLLDWKEIREFMIYKLSDAGSLENSRCKKNGVYQQVQERIYEGMNSCFDKMKDPSCSILIVAHSLGGHVISNYIWDSHKQSVNWGFWGSEAGQNIKRYNDDQSKFHTFKTLRTLYTIGCNIPLFVAGMPAKYIEVIKKKFLHKKFTWENYYDKDDVLGWPLKQLNKSYSCLVNDHSINVGSFWKSWNPFSHTGYWEDQDFLDPLTKQMVFLLSQSEP